MAKTPRNRPRNQETKKPDKKPRNQETKKPTKQLRKRAPRNQEAGQETKKPRNHKRNKKQKKNNPPLFLVSVSAYSQETEKPVKKQRHQETKKPRSHARNQETKKHFIYWNTWAPTRANKTIEIRLLNFWSSWTWERYSEKHEKDILLSSNSTHHCKFKEVGSGLYCPWFILNVLMPQNPRIRSFPFRGCHQAARLRC